MGLLGGALLPRSGEFVVLVCRMSTQPVLKRAYLRPAPSAFAGAPTIAWTVLGMIPVLRDVFAFFSIA